MSEIDNISNTKDIVPQLDQDPKHIDESRAFWNQQTTDKSGVLLGHTEGNDENLKLIKEFVDKSI